MTINRIDACFSRLRKEGKSAFIAFVTAGDPSMALTLDIVRALEEAGTDILELGLPFSDPLADGAVIQAAAGRSLAAGGSTAGVLQLVREIRAFSQMPIVLFTYLNPIYTYGFDRFHKEAAAAGADGILLLDLPPDEAAQNPEFHIATQSAGALCQIRLIAPTTPPERVKTIAARAEGFVYYVSRAGVTGAQSSLAEGLGEQVARITEHAAVPVAVGFGISTPEQAREVAGYAEGVVVGSAIVKVIAEHGAKPDLAARVLQFVKPLVEATKSV